MVTDIFTQPLHHKKAPDGPDTSRTFSPQSKSEERQLPVAVTLFGKWNIYHRGSSRLEAMSKTIIQSSLF